MGYFEVIINISDGKGPSGGFRGRPSAQKQCFPRSMFIPKMSVGRSCVKLNYFSLSGEQTNFPAQLMVRTLLQYFLLST